MTDYFDDDVDPEGMFSNEELTQLIDRNVSMICQEIGAGIKGEVVPRIWIAAISGDEKKEHMILINELPDTMPGRMQLMRTAGYTFGKQGEGTPLAVIFVCSALMTKYTPGESIRIPSQSPNRQEIVLVSAYTFDMRASAKLIYVDRDPDDNLLFLYSSNEGEHESIISPLLQMFMMGFVESLMDRNARNN